MLGTVEKLFPAFLFQQNQQPVFPGIQPITMPVMANGPQNQVYNTTTSTRDQKNIQVNEDNRMTMNNTFNVTGSNSNATARAIGYRLQTIRNREMSSWTNGRLSNLDKMDKN